jgi:hypothetical protein
MEPDQESDADQQNNQWNKEMDIRDDGSGSFKESHMAFDHWLGWQLSLKIDGIVRPMIARLSNGEGQPAFASPTHSHSKDNLVCMNAGFV